MRIFFNKHKFVLLTFLVGLILLFCFYYTVLLSPNDYLFAPTGDGIKNYYSFIYHAKYDTSFSDFSGMNYPYYEHIVYTDAHPLLSWLIGKLGLVAYGIGILNVLMLLSIPIGAAFIFKIIRHYGVANFWAFGGAICIAFLSPQLFRLGGHLSLSYVFAIPIMWWLLIKCVNGKPWKWSIITCLYLFVFFFTHPYLGMILVFFSIIFWCVRWIAQRKEGWKTFGHIGIQALLPVVGFQVYVYLTDTHIDRLSNPAGFFDYYASWKSLLIAHHGPLAPVSRYLEINIGNWESWCYIGFSTVVFAFIIGWELWKSRQSISVKNLLKKELFLFLIAAYLILLFAFCFPLKYNWLRWVAELFGPLKQFRVLGRFTWIFYYVFTVATVVGMYKLYQRQQKTIFAVIFSFGLVFYAVEFVPAHLETAKSISQSANTFKLEAVDPDLQEVVKYVNENDYDAILFLPFHHMSSENLMLLGAEKANFDSFLMSYHTHLPLINSTSSRISLSETIRVNNYFSPGFMEKELTYDLPKDAKIALIKNRDLLSIQELRMIWESEVIFENETFLVYYFDPIKWNSPDRFNKIVAQERAAKVDVGQGWRSDTTGVWFYYESFDTCKSDLSANEILGGTGAYRDLKSSWNTILSFEDNELEPGNYVVRYWYYLREDRPDVEAVVEAKFTASDSTAWLSNFDVKQSTVIAGDWCLIEQEFEVTPEMGTINFLLTGNGNKKAFIIDELLIQKQNESPLFRKALKGEVPYLIYNNYWLKENSFVAKAPLYPKK